MARQAIDLIDGDDARLLVDQTVAADGGRTCVERAPADRVAFEFVE